MPKTANETLNCPNAKILIDLEVQNPRFLEFLNRTLCPLDHFHQINRRCGNHAARSMLHAWSGHDSWPFRGNEFIQASRFQLHTLLVHPATQNKLNVALPASQLRLL